MKPNTFLLVFLLALSLNCKHSIVPPAHFSIISPAVGNTYYDDMPTLCTIDKNITSITWFSSIDGKLGRGAQISCYLSSGNHVITAHDEQQGTKSSITITVLARKTTEKQSTRFLIPHLPYTCVLKHNRPKPYIASLDGTAIDLTLTAQPLSRQYDSYTGLTAATSSYIPEHEQTLKTFRYNPPIQQLIPATPPDIPRRSAAAIRQNEKQFFIVNTAFQSQQPHRILFKQHYASQNIEVWIPTDTPIDIKAVDACISEFEKVIYRRVTDIWGTTADIDNNGVCTLIFSSTINNEKKALGFFNPADFFTRNTDTASSSYNPASNEGDIIYAALPSSDTASPYFYKAIAATIGHELTHAITFTKKTYNRIKAGNTHAQRPEVFLDEGISHLSENLIGYGVSGGNITFLQEFLSNTRYYSLCKHNAAGLSDLAGQRGAMTLFLSWCFWQKGGMTWDAQNPIQVKDLGGISFLQHLISSPYTGWNAIGEAFGTSTDMLFLQMLDDLRQKCTETAILPYKTDPLTGEAIEFLPCMGKITRAAGAGEQELVIGMPHPQLSRNDELSVLLPYSFAFYRAEDFTFPAHSAQYSLQYTFIGTELHGRVFFCIPKERNASPLMKHAAR